MVEAEGRKLGEDRCLGSRVEEEVPFVEAEGWDGAVRGLGGCLS